MFYPRKNSLFQTTKIMPYMNSAQINALQEFWEYLSGTIDQPINVVDFSFYLSAVKMEFSDTAVTFRACTWIGKWSCGILNLKWHLERQLFTGVTAADLLMSCTFMAYESLRSPHIDPITVKVCILQAAVDGILNYRLQLAETANLPPLEHIF